MKPERSLVAERPLARHCAELVRPVPGPTDPVPVLARAGERMARSLRGALAPLLGGEPPMVECAIGDPIGSADLGTQVQGLVAWSLYRVGATGGRMISAIDAEAVLRLVDRAFGGPGEAPHPLPRELPLSAELMVQRVEKVFAAHLVQAAAMTDPDAIAATRRDSSIEQLQPFAPDTRLVVMTFSITETSRQPWQVRLALPLPLLGDMFAQGDGTAPRTSSRRAVPSDPAARPFGDLPLPLNAVLVDMALPLSVLSELQVGQILSVPIARSIPLRVAGRTIAHGSIGAVDDRVAVQLTQLS